MAAASPSRRRTSPAPRRPARTRRTTARVTGLGGVFFRAHDLDALAAWYRTHLGVPAGENGCTGAEIRCHVFQWRQPDDPQRAGATVWSLFKQDTSYLGPGEPAFMLNYRVDDLDALVAKLQSEGIYVGPERSQDENGRFAWVTDPEGHRIELWEPAPGH